LQSEKDAHQNNYEQNGSQQNDAKQNATQQKDSQHKISQHNDTWNIAVALLIHLSTECWVKILVFSLLSVNFLIDIQQNVIVLSVSLRNDIVLILIQLPNIISAITLTISS
jgi:hypothetical protein